MRETVKVTFQIEFKMNGAADSMQIKTALEGSKYGNVDVYRKDFKTFQNPIKPAKDAVDFTSVRVVICTHLYHQF